MLCFVFAALVVLLDQFIKHWIVLTLPLHENTGLIPGILGLTHIENSGAAFSILADQRWLLAGIAFAAALILIFILLRYNEGFWGTLGLASVLGGTVGNLIDRVFHGYVVDMFVPEFINFAVFNVADIFITLGGITFCIFFIITSFRPYGSGKGALESADDSIDAQQDGEYEYPDWQDDGDFDSLSDTKVIPPKQRPSEFVSQAEEPAAQPEQESYFEAEPDIEEYSEAEPDREEYFDAEPEQEVYYETEPAQPEYVEIIPDPPEDMISTLEALGSLESELSALDDYDVDSLLREYGFEDEETFE